MPCPARSSAPAVLAACCLAVLAVGAGLAGASAPAAGASVAGASAPPAGPTTSSSGRQDPTATADDPLAFTAEPSPLAGPQSAAGFQRALGLVDLAPAHTPSARVRDGAAPRHHRVPDPVMRAILAMTAAGDRIATLPYTYGGGHGSFTSAGYDCSGSVSYVLHAAGLLSIPADSSGMESFGAAGPGRHVTIYADAAHAFMTIDGRRFDTIAFQETGTRWSSAVGSTAGYVERHPAGL